MIILGLAGGILLAVFKTYQLKFPLLKPLVGLIGYILTMLIALKYAIRKSKQQEGKHFRINFDKAPIWLFPVLIICTLALVVLLGPVSHLIPMPVFIQKFFEKMLAKDIFSIITAVIAAPIFEEILCRGIVLKGLLTNYSPNKAILISAIFFAALHMNPWQALPAFFGGLFIGWVYYKTQSVIPGMVIHATINGTALALWFLSNQVKSFSLMPYYILLCVLAALIFSLGCIMIQKKLPTAKQSSN